MNKKLTLNHLLLKISKEMAEGDQHPGRLSDEQSNLFSKIILPRFHNHKLNLEHVPIIARMFDKTVSGSGRIEPLSLLREIYKDIHIVLEKLDLILELIKLRIIDCGNKKYMKVHRKDNESILKLDRSMLIDVYIGFTERFMTFVLNPGVLTFSSEPKPFKHNQEYVRSWFEYVEALYEARCLQRYQNSPDSAEVEAFSLKSEIDLRLACTTKTFQFQMLVNDYNLSDTEQIVLMYVLKESLDSNSSTDDELQILLNNTIFTKYSRSSILSSKGTLIKEGLILRSEEDELSLRCSEFEIAPDIGSLILNDKPHSDIAIIQDIMKYNDIFTINRPALTMKQMVLPRDQKVTMREALSRYGADSVDCLRDWGVCDPHEDSNSKARKQKSASLSAD